MRNIYRTKFIVIAILGIVVTVVGFDDSGHVVHRWPVPEHRNPDDQVYHFKQGPNCWSLFGIHSSQFDNARIESLLQQHSGTPAGGMVIVEVFYGHPHLIGLFNIGDFIPDPIQIHSYTVFPVTAAEPTPTPPP